MGTLGFILAIVCFEVIMLESCGEPIEDKQALLDFIGKIHHSRKLNWEEKTPMCTKWTGVTCNANETNVIALRLPGVGLVGSLPLKPISRLSGLQTLSLRANLISGPLPSNVSVWRNISTINLSRNNLSGGIPSSFSNLTHLTSLDLSNNFLSGEIPDFNLPGLIFLNLSNNNLSGTIPSSLSRFPSSAFSGNNLSSPSPPTTKRRRQTQLSEASVLGIIIGGCFFLFGVIAACILICCPNKETTTPVSNAKEKSFPKKKSVGSITFMEAESSNLAFGLEDLLGAGAELLGKGVFGTTYKVGLEDWATVVVKRLKGVAVSKRDFEQQMGSLGGIKHESVGALRAYYFSNDEKLMVYDYFSSGSVSALLHGKRGAPLTWEARLRIAIGGARGLAHIHGGKLIHGNIKSSNFFLNSDEYGCVSEVGLAAIVTPLAVTRSVGYRAPEMMERRKATQASDVYSFGVFLLELLTGKSPLEEESPLVGWVNSVVREEWTAEVFDVELLRYPNCEAQMVQMLQLGITCTLRAPDKRPAMGDVCRILEEIGVDRSGGSTPTSASNAILGIGSFSGTTSQ